MAEEAKDPLKKLIESYRKRLSNFSRRNRELFFRPSNLAICLSQLDANFRIGAEALESSGGRTQAGKESPGFDALRLPGVKWDTFAASGELNLHTHLSLSHKRMATTRARVEKLRRSDLAFQREYGISGAWLFGPFLLWRAATGPEAGELMITPVLKLAIDINVGTAKSPILTLENDALEINPSLRIAFSELLRVKLPELGDAANAAELVERIRSLLNAHNLVTDWLSPSPGAIPELAGKLLPTLETEEESPSGPEAATESAQPRLLSASDKNLHATVTSERFLLVDAFYIDHLPATRMPLFKDYDQILKHADAHPLLRGLLLGARETSERSSGASARALDAAQENENFFVVSTDSSQHAAIDAARGKRALVIQGPPGTGKSQTITNLIADKLAQGKTVLFVAEKRAALDVVHNRLSLAQVQEQAVIVHDAGLDKAALYADFLKSAEKAQNLRDAAAWANAAKHLEMTKGSLNRYYDILAHVDPRIGINVSDLLAHAAHVEAQEISPAQGALADLLKGIPFDQIENLKIEAEGLRLAAALVPGLARHPWRYLRSGLRKAEVEAPLRALLEQAQELETQAQDAFNSFREYAPGLDIFATEKQDLEAARAALEEAFSHSAEALMVEHWPSLLEALRFRAVRETLREIESTLNAERSSVDVFKDDALGSELAPLSQYFALPAGKTRWLSPTYWSMRRRLHAIVKPGTGLPRAIEALAGAKKYFEATEQLCNTSRSFGARADVSLVATYEEAISFLEGTRTRLEMSRQLRETLKTPLQSASSRPYPQTRAELLDLARRAESAAVALACFQGLRDALHALGESCSAWLSAAPAWMEDGAFAYSLRLRELLESANDLKALERVFVDGSAFGKRFGLDNFMDAPAACVARLAECAESDQAPDWGAYAEAAVIGNWVSELMRSSTDLRLFERNQFEKRRQDFAALETKHRAAARGALANAFAKRLDDSEPDADAIAQLRLEAGKKRKVRYPRELMERGALQSMLTLKPCWLMSPLSISQILPMVSGMFDVVIFDEASQVRVEEALPAVFRGQSIVVVGDTEQMPPTNFFGSGGAGDEDEDEEIAVSVLDLAARQFPGTVLAWHYRSRSEALIAFSNRAYYGARLIAAPNPALLGHDGALEFIAVPDATYSSKDGNVQEAEAIVARLAELLLSGAETPSIGVIAMGMVQAEAIQDAIGRRVESDRAFNAAFRQAEARNEGGSDAGLFVKNLENVQGDERDVILLSIGYAPLAPGARLLQNFGPLSKSGGRRRLNVATTRAKAKQIVFCSFDPALIDCGEDAYARNPDLACFGRYLRFARALSRGDAQEAKNMLDSFGEAKAAGADASAFSRDVARRLRERGHEVDISIGNSGFFIDLGIRDPQSPGTYLLGIECDGAFFHATPYSRDRDKARDELLKSRGWEILRVWSPDWQKDWKAEVERIDARARALVEAIKKPRNQASAV